MSEQPKQLELKRLTKDELIHDELVSGERDYWRPVTRADCENGPRPCPYVGCRYNLYLTVIRPGGRKNPMVKIGHSGKEPWELKETCALDVASAPSPSEDSKWEWTLKEVGEMLGFTRERARQIEAEALVKLKRAAPRVFKDLFNDV